MSTTDNLYIANQAVLLARATIDLVGAGTKVTSSALDTASIAVGDLLDLHGMELSNDVRDVLDRCMHDEDPVPVWQAAVEVLREGAYQLLSEEEADPSYTSDRERINQLIDSIESARKELYLT